MQNNPSRNSHSLSQFSMATPPVALSEDPPPPPIHTPNCLSSPPPPPLLRLISSIRLRIISKFSTISLRTSTLSG